MPKTPTLVLAILAHEGEEPLRQLVRNARAFCPEAELVLYNSGDDPQLGSDLGVEMFPRPRRLLYSKVTRFFFDLFDWLTATGRRFDFLVNLESDMLFIRPGFARFLHGSMRRSDYMGPLLARYTSRTCRWRPIRTLRPELERWYEVFGFRHTHRSFSPGQVFSRRYVERLVGHPRYRDLLRLTDENRSNSLQEVLFPTLIDLLGLPGRCYPGELKSVNRYRPFQAVSGLRHALSFPRAYFLHPVRRGGDDPTRRKILELTTAREAELA